MQPEALTWQSVLWRFAIVFILILFNAFFVAAEFSLVGARRSRLREKALERNRQARWARLAEKLVHNLDEAIAATQLGITITSLLVGWIGEQTLAAVFLDFFRNLPPTVAKIASHTVASGCAFALITLMHVVIGELIPKGIAIRYPNRTAIYVSPPMRFVMMLFKPFVWALNGLGNFGLKLLGMPAQRGHQMVHSVEELKYLIEASHQGGTLNATEKDLLKKVFKFGDLVARQVMVPRPDMSCISLNASLEEVVEISRKTGHTRFPVYENTIDNIVGILHSKDVVHHLHANAPFHLERIMKEAQFVPEAMPIVQLLSFFREKHTQMVVVVDEFGGTSGLVTLEDVIEEIVGDFYDEHHPVIAQLVQLNEREAILQARVRLDEINEKFHLHLESEADTIGGYVLQKLGSIPHVGDKIEVPGAVIKVEEMSKWKIKSVRLVLQPQPVESE
jgi:CBS domain containing-hemolysin-like protein